MNIVKKIVLLSFFMVLTCTYSFRSGSFKGTVEIYPLENNTTSADIERILTEELIDAFIKDGRIKIKRNADFTLRGIITGYDIKPDSYTSSGEVEEYRLAVKVDFSLTDNKEDNIEWEDIIRESIVYSSSEDETEAVEKVVERLKDSLLRNMLETW